MPLGMTNFDKKTPPMTEDEIRFSPELEIHQTEVLLIMPKNLFTFVVREMVPHFGSN